MILVFVVLAALPPETIWVGESEGSRFELRNDRVRELGPYAIVGGNLAFSFDLEPSCKLLVVNKEGDGTFKLVVQDPASTSPTRPLFSSPFPISNPRWSADGRSWGVVTGSKSETTVMIKAPDREAFVTIPGDNFIWLNDNTLVVHRVSRGDSLCHTFSRFRIDGLQLSSRQVCGGLNVWLPVAGYLPEVPVVLIDEVRGKTQLRLEENAAARVEVNFEHAFNAVACPRGVSFETEPVYSVVRESDNWRFSGEDVCGIRESASPFEGRIAPRAWRKIQACAARR